MKLRKIGSHSESHVAELEAAEEVADLIEKEGREAPHMPPGGAIVDTVSVNSDMPNPIQLAPRLRELHRRLGADAG